MRNESKTPRPDLRGASKKDRTLTGSAFFQDTCLGPGCGACYITAIGDRRWCEVEAISALKRELARALEGEGSRG